MLLPYMEQAPLFNAANFFVTMRGNGYSEAINTTTTTAQIASMLCPSSSLTIGTWYGAKWPGNNYFASTGSSLMWLGGQSSNPNGPFANGGNANGVRDIQDGTSNTVAFGEWRTGDYDDGKDSLQDIVGNNSFTTFTGCTNRNMVCPNANFPNGQGFITTALQTCATNWKAKSNGYGTNAQRSWNGRLWAEGIYAHALGNLVVPPNSPFPYCQFWDTNSDYDSSGINGLTSYHPGGANVCMADGSVKFLKSSISYQTLWSLGSMSQGEVVSADAY